MVGGQPVLKEGDSLWGVSFPSEPSRVYVLTTGT